MALPSSRMATLTIPTNRSVTFSMAAICAGIPVVDPMPLARNVDALNFVYLDEDGNITSYDGRRPHHRGGYRGPCRTGGWWVHAFLYRHPKLSEFTGQCDLRAGDIHDSFRRLLLTKSITCYNMAN